jgi:hypothetical protein
MMTTEPMMMIMTASPTKMSIDVIGDDDARFC